MRLASRIQERERSQVDEKFETCYPPEIDALTSYLNAIITSNSDLRDLFMSTVTRDDLFDSLRDGLILVALVSKINQQFEKNASVLFDKPPDKRRSDSLKVNFSHFLISVSPYLE